MKMFARVALIGLLLCSIFANSGCFFVGYMIGKAQREKNQQSVEKKGNDAEGDKSNTCETH